MVAIVLNMADIAIIMIMLQTIRADLELVTMEKQDAVWMVNSEGLPLVFLIVATTPAIFFVQGLVFVQ